MLKNKITVIVLTKNEEENITKCLASLKFSDEIIIVDDYSEDSTLDLAKKHKVKIYKRKLNGNFAKQRNFGLSKSSSDWVLFVDADEIVSKKLANEILKKINSRDLLNSGYFVTRKDTIFGKIINYSEFGKIKLLRLAKKRSGRWKRKVHEYWDVDGNLGYLENTLDHYPHKTLKSFLSNINNFSSLHAQSNMDEGKKSSLLKVIFWPIAKFINIYILELGFLDGIVGLVLALLMSAHSFFSWSKLWLMQK